MAVTKFFRLTLVLASLVSGAIACTSEKSDMSLGAGNGAKTGESTTAKAVSDAAQVSCSSPEAAMEIQAFDKTEGEWLDLERETLPRGLFLATVSELLVEKKSDPSAPTRVLVSEVVGGDGAKIVCSENADKLGDEFEMALTGLVKFETTEKREGSKFVSRQFYFFQDKTGLGAVFSNPRSPSKMAAPLTDLKQALKAAGYNGQLVRIGETAYQLRYQRERDGVRARLLIRLDLIPQ